MFPNMTRFSFRCRLSCVLQIISLLFPSAVRALRKYDAFVRAYCVNVRTSVPQMAQAEARTAVARRMKQGDVPALFGSFFWRFMRAVRTQRRAERRPWGEIRTRLVTELFLPTRLPEDPFRAAAYATAALLLETIPFEASSNNATLQRASPRVLCSPRRALVSPAQATAAEAEEQMAERKPSPPSAVEIDTTARYAVKSPPPATADVVHNPPLRTPPALGMPTTPTAPTLGTKPAMKSVTKGYGPNLLCASQQLENRASPDHAGSSFPSSMSGGQHAYTANATAASAAMVTPAGIGQGVGARVGRLPRQPAPETEEDDEVDLELVHEKLGSACPEPQDLYPRQAGGGGVDAPSTSPQNLRTSEPGTSDVYAMAVAAAEAAAASAAAADRAAQAAEAAEAAAAAAAEDPIPAVAGARGDGSGDATAAGIFNHSYASAVGGRFCGDASDPTDGDRGRRAGEKRKAANAEGDDEESQCDGGQRKKTRLG